MATYIAVSTINYQENGYTVYAKGHDKNQVEADGFDAVKDEIYSDTLTTNLRVITKTTAKKHHKIDVDNLVKNEQGAFVSIFQY